MEFNNNNQYISSNNNKIDKVTILDPSNIPWYEGIPRRLWISKCVVLCNAQGVSVVDKICCNVSFNVIIGFLCSLRDAHVEVQVSSSLSKDDIPDDWTYSI